MDKNPPISVIMPAYNAEAYLPEAVNGILNQTFPDFEFIIIDDGSTDRTRYILESFDDRRIRIIHNPENIGLVESLVKGIAGARGELVARQDADDISLPERLAAQFEYLSANSETGLVGTFYQRIDRDGLPVSEGNQPTSDEEIRSKIESHNCFCHGSVMFRRTAYDRAGGYRDLAGPTEDLDLWLRMLELTQGANVPRILYQYRILPGSILRSSDPELSSDCEHLVRKVAALRKTRGECPFTAQDEEIIRERKAILYRLGNIPPVSAKKAEAAYQYLLAEEFIKSGKTGKALITSLKSLFRKPFNPAGWRLLAGIIRKSAGL